ncbi:MAG TPA: ABC transporter permease [Syntrophales bacterium]|nr:ABC transporter permease [Syntrophales bacterium]
MAQILKTLGSPFVKNVLSVQETLAFAGVVISKVFSRRSYNSATKMVLVNQIYFTAVEILPLFITVSIIFGSLLIGIVFAVIKDLGLAEYLGSILMGFVVTELAPFITVLLIALRSSSAIDAEIAVMKVNQELNTLSLFNIDVLDYLFVPRIVNGMVSIVLLSSLFSILVLGSGMLFSFFMFGMGLDTYANTLLNSTKFSDIVIMLLKCMTFGFFITLIPIRFGLRASQELTSIPVAVLNGMVKVFIAIVIIEVLSLILRFI